jgi:4-hydroxy-3-polyprenylbenzoate decarboxylase
MTDKPVVVGICGASGVAYGIRLIKALVEAKTGILVLLSDGGRKVLSHEMGYDPDRPFTEFLTSYGVALTADSRIDLYLQDDTAAPPASGSFVHQGMAICPCSMKTLSSVASGYADNLITRSADVCLKEERPLILVPRETPYNLIHLENMVRVKKAGAVVLPASPGFYQFPRTIDDLLDTVVARILDHMKIGHRLVARWGDS